MPILALWPTRLLIQWVLAAVSLGVRWLGLEADHSPPSTGKVKSAWNYTFTFAHTSNNKCLRKVEGLKFS
jgi:hypothetical protein